MTDRFERVLQFLRQTNLVAADQVLGCALSAEGGDRAPVLAEALLRRGTDPAVAHVVRAYHKVDDASRKALVGLCPGISGALRSVSQDENVQVRMNVVQLICAARHPKLSYILSYLLHDPIPAVRTAAAGAYKALALALFIRLCESTRDADVPGPGNLSGELADGISHFFSSLDAALESFPSHLRTEIIEAAMYFGPLLPEGIWSKFTGDRSRIGRAAVEIFQRDSSAHFAGFAFRSLTDLELGKLMAKIVASVCGTEFIRRFLTFGWYRYDLTVRKNLARSNRGFRWLVGNHPALGDLNGEAQIRFVDLLLLTTIPQVEKLSALWTLLGLADPFVQEHVVSQAAGMESPEARKFLARVTAGEADFPISNRASRMAGRFLARMSPTGASGTVIGSPAPLETGGSEPGIEQYFDQFWIAFEPLEAETFGSALERLRRLDPQFDGQVQSKLTSSDPAARARAVRLILKGKMATRFTHELFAVCDDIDAAVRASAVRALGELSGPEVEHKIIESLDDDDPRVQANAVEALETFNPPDLLALLEDRLEHPNNRIRANAIKAILKPQYTLALRALSSMLDHPDPTFRRSALWAVIKTTPLHLGKKINQLAQDDPDPEVRSAAKQALGAMVQYWKETRKVEPQPAGSAEGGP